MTNISEEITEMYLPTGTEVSYYVLCRRKLWWRSHGFEQENVQGNQGSENVELGNLLHERTFPAESGRVKEAMIDGKLRIDFTEDGIVHEVKKSRGGDRATRMQVLYYLWYLKHQKGVETTGVIHYPKEKRTVPIGLTPRIEREIEEMLEEIEGVRNRETPPEVTAPMPLCAKCSYQDLCWG